MEKLDRTIIFVNEMLDSNNLNTQEQREQAIMLGDDLQALRLAQYIIKRYDVQD